MGVVTETAPDVLVPGVKKKPQKVAVSRVKGPSSLSMGTADILKMLSTASPATVGVSMRALQDVERSGQRADQGLDVLRRRAEAEADTEKQQARRRGPPKILSIQEWGRQQPHFAHLKDKTRIKKAQRDSIYAGYEAYLARVAAQAKLDLSYSKDYQQAQKTAADIALRRAQTGQADRANQPQSVGALGTQQLMKTGRMQPNTARRWEQQYSKEPGTEAQDRRADLALTLEKEKSDRDFKYEQDIDIRKAEASVEKARLDRKSRESIAQGNVAQKNDEKIAELLIALADITPRGKPGKPGEKKALFGVDAGWPDTAATPRTYPNREAVETAFHDMEGILAGLRAYGYDEARIAELRRVHGEKFLKTRKPNEEVNGAPTDANR